MLTWSLILGNLLNTLAVVILVRRVTRLEKYRPLSLGMKAERNFVRIKKAGEMIGKLQVGITPTHIALATVKRVADDLAEIE